MSKRKQFVSIVCLVAMAITSIFGFFTVSNVKTVSADTITLTEADASVTDVYVFYGFLWFKIPESDYADAGYSYSIKNNLEEWQEGVEQTKYVEVLSQFVDGFSTKILIDDVALSSFASFLNKDPYFNLFQKVMPSFAFVCSAPSSKIIVKAGAKFPSYAYVKDIVDGGTGDGKPVYVIKENTYFVYKDEKWTGVTEKEYYNAEISSFVSGSSRAAVSLVGGKYGSVEANLSSYTEKLNALNTTSYIKINGVKLSEHDSYGGKTLTELNPYFNYNGTAGFSLGIEVSTSDTVTFMQGCQIPNEGFIAGTGLCNMVKKDVTLIYNSEKSAWQEYIPEQDLTTLFTEVRKVGWEDGVKVEIDVNYQFDDVGNGAFLVDSVGSEKGLLDYITVNGKSVNQINSENSSNSYTFKTFPGSSGGRYATATYVLMTNIGTTGNRINLYIHGDYYKALTDLVVGVSEDFIYNDGATDFTVTKAVTFKEIYGLFINTENIKGKKDITATVNAAKTEIRPDGSVSIRVDLSTVNLTNIGYGVNNINASSVFDYVKVNGKTLSEINSATDTSAYDWSIGKPFSDGADYHKAINVYFTAGFMNLRIHPEYFKTIIGDAAINVSVNVGFKLFDTDDGYEYVLSSATEGCTLATRYTLTVKSGETVLGEEKLIAGSKINLTNYTPVKDYYNFVGYTDVDGNAVALVMPENNYTVKAKFNPIVYTVAFKNGDTTVDTLTYTVENTEITAPSVPVVDDHHTAEWETCILDGGNKIVNLQLVAKIYTVTFKNGDTVVATVNYTVDDTDITVPEVPVKEGYKGGWDFYTLDGGSKTVNAVYEEILTLAIENGGCSSGIDGASIVGISSFMLAVFVLTKKLRRANSK